MDSQPPHNALPSHANTPSPARHTWQFFRAGGVDQVTIRTGADIAQLAELDQKLWVALACPTRGIEFDPRTLDLIDTDKDGRIRPPELLAACAWACARLRDPDTLAQPADALDLDAIDDAGDDGKALAAQARRILALAGQPDATRITLDQVLERSEQLSAMRFNGDGAITPDTAEDDEEAADAVKQIIATHGSVPIEQKAVKGITPPPLQGVDRTHAEAFFGEVAKLHAWAAQASGGTAGMALGDRTLDATQALNAVRHKIDDFFARCRLAAYDPRAAAALNPTPEEYAAMAGTDLDAASPAVAALPLAPITAHGTLPLAHGVNPAWAEALQAFREKAVEPLLGRAAGVLSEDEWQQVQKALAPCQKWLADKPATKLGALKADAIRQLHESGVRERVMALIDQDEAEKAHNTQTADLEKLLRLRRDLLVLLNNFVSFSAFYQREGAIFQAGTLYLDARSCDLTVQVADAGKHAKLAGLAKTYLAYCDCTRKGQKMTIVAAFTAGDVDFLFVGRNGVFYDRQGHDWDATITKLIENPTSIGQAFFSPYKKFLRMIEEQVAKRASASDARVEKSLGATAGQLANTPLKPAGAAPSSTVAEPMRRTDVGTVAAIGVALGSISAVLVGIFGKFVDLGVWIPLAIIGIVLAISGPSMLIAWLKLRQRSLGPILDASGWAINGRMRINTRLGGSLSQTARVPANARRLLDDPFAEPRRPVWLLAVGLVLIAVLAVAAWRWYRTERAPTPAPAAAVQAPAAAVPASAASAPPAPTPAASAAR
ncbi:hypothetical protein [Paracidovorax valerianellae]|uniref:EF-hand domain-containing protein n=1 Tax=Paracidovorax valerianellae TaxID=187868 RepID=A0A1G6JLM3_9BURK|nr:hypothetical protein [Paracidovorax valerianellae]MDA8445324.1 hypothetical protein [Paracidovorax valerianellae]SDC19640.1 hypothetical protein SAMN05192589_101435 [Paracidovorax valerianellae]